MPKLGVNIDHIATLRQQRHPSSLDLVFAARLCENAGADSIVAHLREDRRHIQDKDVIALRRAVKTRFNLEMSIAPDIVDIACRIKPDQSTLVPEKRMELTTEGGLDAAKMYRRLVKAVHKLKKNGIDVSLFIEPDVRQIRIAKDLGAGIIEIHTGSYANAKAIKGIKDNLAKIKAAVGFAHDIGLVVNAGHGLDYNNVCAIASMAHIYELNIGYSIVCQSLFIGLEKAVSKMKELAG